MAFTRPTPSISLARFFLLGCALCILAWHGHAHATPAPAPSSAYAAPPPLPLAPLPPPELAPLEFPRRPLEIVPELALALPGCGAGARCGSPGAALGLTALWRATPFFAFGGAVLRGPREAHERTTFYGLVTRLYFEERGSVEPYLELGLGAAPQAAARAGGGVEFFLGRHVRLGPAFTWTTIRANSGVAAWSVRLSFLFGHGT